MVVSLIANYTIDTVGDFVAYQIPKSAFKLATYVPHWFGKNILHIADAAISHGTELTNIQDPQIKELIRPYYHVAAEKAGELFNNASQSIGELWEKQTEIKSFNAVELIVPALFLSFCGSQVVSNATEALKHFKRLVTGQFEQRSNVNYTSGNAMINYSMVRKTSPYSLLGYIGMEALLTMIFGNLANFAYKGMVEDLKKEGTSEQQAEMIVHAILSVFVVASIGTKLLSNISFSKDVMVPQAPPSRENRGEDNFFKQVVAPVGGL